MRRKYPRQAKYFTVEALRAMLSIILRQSVSALKKLVDTQNRVDLPKLEKHKDQIVKNILSCPECSRLRRKLIRFYESDHIDFNLVI